MRQPSSAYTSEPDMPCQIPTRSISGEVQADHDHVDVGAMPSSGTPAPRR